MIRELQLHMQGLSYAEIAERLGCTRNAVAGRIHRANNPYVRRGTRPFRDEGRVRAAVKRITEVGLMQAAEDCAVDFTQLYKWWKRLEAVDGCQYPSPSQGRKRGRRYNSKLNRELPEICSRRAAGETLAGIARTYGVSSVAILYALRRAEAA